MPSITPVLGHLFSLPASAGIRHASGAQIYTQAKHSFPLRKTKDLKRMKEGVMSGHQTQAGMTVIKS